MSTPFSIAAAHLKVFVNGKLFTEYLFKDVPRPYFYPLMGPGEAAMTDCEPAKSLYARLPALVSQASDTYLSRVTRPAVRLPWG